MLYALQNGVNADAGRPAGVQADYFDTLDRNNEIQAEKGGFWFRRETCS